MIPKVSIVIPICNTGKYLENTLSSAVNQTLKEIEIICVDDYSTDNCREIIESFYKKDKRIVPIYHQENLSTSQARKDGALASTGKYIMFLDGDDELALDACEVAYTAIERSCTDIVQFRTEIVNCANVPEARIASNLRLTEPCLERLEDENLVKLCWEEERFHFQIWNKIYQGNLVREAFLEVENGSFPKAQDLYAFFIIAFHAKTYLGIENILYKYKFGLGVTGGNTVTLKKFKVLLTEKYVGDALLRFVQSKGLEKDLGSIVYNIQEHFLNECYCRWQNNLEYETKNEGFRLLCNTFGFAVVIDYLARNKWDQRKELMNSLQDVDYFQYLPRANTKRKTIAAYYRCICNGGAQRVVAMLCNRWAAMVDEAGHPLYNVVLITDEGPLENEYLLDERIQRAYVPAYASSEKTNYQARLLTWQQLLDTFAIDVVVSSLWVAPCTFWDMLAIKGHRSHPAFMIHAHSYCGAPFTFTGKEAIDMMLKYEFCDGVAALSQCDAFYISAFNRNVKHIPNPLAFNPSEIANSEHNKKALVWCGRISGEKRPLDVIKAMELIVKEVPEAKLFVVGEGDEALLQKMRELTQERNLEDNIVFTGFSLDVSQYYIQASALLVTSEYEGFSLVMGEAMSYSVPVISYDMPSLSFIRDGRGIITVPQQNYELMAKQAVRLLQNQQQTIELGKVAKEHIIDVYNTDIEGAWRELFSNADTLQDKPIATTEAIVLKQLTECQALGREKALRKETWQRQKQEKVLQDKLGAAQWELGKVRWERDNAQWELGKTRWERDNAQWELGKLRWDFDNTKWELEHNTGKQELEKANVELNAKQQDLDNARAELEVKRQELDALKAELNARQQELANVQEELSTTQIARDYFAKEWNDVKTGLSFRIGRIITYIPRKLFGRK